MRARESLSLFMFQKPMAAKRLYFDVIPRTVDEYLGFLDAYPRQEWKERLGNPVWHIHAGAPPAPERLAHGDGETPVSFSMLLNLAAVANSENPAVLWGFLRRYAPSRFAGDPSAARPPRRLCGRLFPRFRRAEEALPRRPTRSSARRSKRCRPVLAALPADASAEVIQHALYDLARPIPRYQDLNAKGATPERPGVSNDWFNMLYQVLLGEERGPRFGSFIALYGIEETRALIARALAGELAAERVT